MRSLGTRLALWALFAFALAGVPAGADDATCREWRDEHRAWKVESMRLYLLGAPDRELEMALFEMMQREAYLTSCELPVQVGRAELVGWRLVGRIPEQYGSGVLESVLAQAGFDLELGDLFDARPPTTTSVLAPDRGR